MNEITNQPLSKNYTCHQLQSLIIYKCKILVKFNKSILWESMSCMKCAVRNIAYIIIVNHMPEILYISKIYSQL